MTTEADIQKGKGLLANPEFILTFGLSAFLAIAGTVSIIASWLNTSEEGAIDGIRIGAVVTIVVLGALLAGAAVLERMGHGAEALLMGLVMAIGVAAGIVAVLTLFMLWGSPPDNGWMGVEGFDKPLIAALIAVLMIVLAPAVIYGESILPIFVAFVAGVWGILSVIVFVMVVFIGVE